MPALRAKVLKRVYNAGDARLGEGATPFMRAARGGDVAVMRLLLAVRRRSGLDAEKRHDADHAGRQSSRPKGTTRIAVRKKARSRPSSCVWTGTSTSTPSTARATPRFTSPSVRRRSSASWPGQGARLDIKNKRGLTPLDAARASRNADSRTVALLRELTGAPADPDQQRVHGPPAATCPIRAFLFVRSVRLQADRRPAKKAGHYARVENALRRIS